VEIFFLTKIFGIANEKESDVESDSIAEQAGKGRGIKGQTG
jgi:hypothetical protein